jgi:hypothetical protein
MGFRFKDFRVSVKDVNLTRGRPVYSNHHGVVHQSLDLGVGIWKLGFRVKGLGLRVEGLGCRVWRLEFRV